MIKPKGQGYSAHRWARTSSHHLLKGWERKSKGLLASARLGPKQLSKRFKSRGKPWYRHLFCDRWASVQAVQLGTELSSKRREKGWSNALSIWHGSLAITCAGLLSNLKQPQTVQTMLARTFWFRLKDGARNKCRGTLWGDSFAKRMLKQKLRHFSHV